MFGGNRITVDVWVDVASGCHIDCQVVGDQAQFTFGSPGQTLMLTLTEDLLARLAPLTCDALARWRAIPVGAEVSFQVIDSANRSAADQVVPGEKLGKI